jgi:PST family polysaccharide transporter
MSIVVIAATIAQLGIPSNLIYLENVGQATVAAALWIGLASALSAGAIIWLGYCLVVGPDGGHWDVVVVAAICYLPIQIVIVVLDALLRRALQFRILALSELASTLIGSLGVASLLAWIGWGFWALIVGQGVYGTIRISTLAYANKECLSLSSQANEFRRIIAASTAITVAEAANVIAVFGQRPIVGIEMGVAAAGIWSRFYQVISIQLSATVEPMDRLVLPTLARQRQDGERVRRNLHALIEMVTLITLPLALITALIAPIAVPLAFGERWGELIIPLQIGAVTVFFRGIDRVLLSTARALGAMRARAFAQVIQLVVIIGTLYATAPYGLAATALGFVVAQALCIAMMIIVAGRSAEARARDLACAFVPGAVVAALALGATLATCALAERPPAGVLGVAVAAGALLASGLFAATFPNRVFSPAAAGLVTAARSGIISTCRIVTVRVFGVAPGSRV